MASSIFGNAFPVLAVVLILANASLAANDDSNLNRIGAPVQPDVEHRLVAKFRNDLKARAVGLGIESRVNAANDFVSSLALDRGATFEQLIQMDEDELASFLARAEATSGRKQPDLASMIVIHAPVDSLQAIANALHDSEFVDWVEFETVNPEPPVWQDCEDIAPATPNYVNNQGYRAPNPGFNMDAFWMLGNARGSGIKVADCEYWFNGDHEDICGVAAEPGQTPNPQVIANNWHQHGTAALGEIIGGDNGFGILGLAVDAESYFFPEWTIEGGSRRTTAIANAAATMDVGDIVLLEMQTTGSSGFGPAELSLSVWNVVRTASDAGVIVVAAAGNGNQNLDDASYSSYMARGDSGSIIVGAGSSSTAHNKLSFSTYGSRVDVQAWGGSVFTTGYGGFSQIGGDPNQNYTSSFNGTSSACALIAGVCASLQSYSVAAIDRRLTPAEMRQVLRETGWPQGSGGHIGRFPNMVEAGEWILDLAPQFEPGDVNRDGAINLLDVALFVDLVESGQYRYEADINQDDSVNLLDVTPFVDLLTGG